MTAVFLRSCPLQPSHNHSLGRGQNDYEKKENDKRCMQDPSSSTGLHAHLWKCNEYTQPEQSSSCSSAVGAGGRDGKEETFLGHQGQGAWTSGFSMTIFTHPMIRNRHASRVFVQFEQQKGALGAALPPALSHLSAKMALPSGGSSVRSHPRAHTHTHMGCLSYKAIPRGS